MILQDFLLLMYSIYNADVEKKNNLLCLVTQGLSSWSYQTSRPTFQVLRPPYYTLGRIHMARNIIATILKTSPKNTLSFRNISNLFHIPQNHRFVLNLKIYIYTTLFSICEDNFIDQPSGPVLWTWPGSFTSVMDYKGHVFSRLEFSLWPWNRKP